MLQLLSLVSAGNVAIAFLLYAAILAFHRLYWSPVAHIPGPKLAALTYWYEFYFDVVKKGQYVFKVQRLHDIYGPIIRISPHQVHIADPYFLNDIYVKPKRINRDPAAQGGFNATSSVGSTIEHDLHRKRREAISPFFSKKSVGELEPLVQGKVDELFEVLRNSISSGKVVNLSDIFFALSRDIICEYSFGESDDFLGSIEMAGHQRDNQTSLMSGYHTNKNMSWVFQTLDLLPQWAVLQVAPPGMRDFIHLQNTLDIKVGKVLGGTEESKDFGQRRTIFHEMRDSTSMDPLEKSRKHLSDEGFLLVLAGTETSARTLSIIVYYLFSNRTVLSDLRAELRANPTAASWTQLEQLPYLTGVVLEGIRLNMGLSGRNSRILPNENLSYHGIQVPAGTPVGTMSLFVNCNEELYPQPWEFRPERWIGEQGKLLRKYMVSFGKGGRMCLGLHLAYVELYLTIARVANFELELWETEEEDVKFCHDFFLTSPRLGSKGVRVVARS